MSDAEPRPDRLETVLVLVLYVVPLTGTVAFLAAVGLPGLALALLSVEAGVSAAVVRARRPEGAGGRRVLVLTALAVVSGAGAAALLAGAGQR